MRRGSRHSWRAAKWVFALAGVAAPSCSADSGVVASDFIGDGGEQLFPPTETPVEQCPLSQTLCGGSCVFLSSNSAHCGACNNACPAGTRCVSGACACLSHLTNCTGTCVDTMTDRGNCGACGTTCGATQACTQGQCTCPDGYTTCGDECLDTTSDVHNCGACGNECAAGQLCLAGQCECQTGLTECPDGCVQLTSDAANCGACGNQCDADQVCSPGECTSGCASGLVQCGTSCVDLSSSPYHCGACDNECPTGRACNDGVCDCPEGQLDCDGSCVDVLTNLDHCGACGNSCSGGQSCVSGTCSCPDGQEFCGDACTDLQTNVLHCGACDNACLADQICEAGSCVCTDGMQLCEQSCVDTQTDPANCGACGEQCASDQTCTDGECTGGAGGTGGSVSDETLLFTWDSANEGWVFNPYQTDAADDPDNLNRSDDAVLSHNASVGDCGDGLAALQVEIPLDGYLQKADIFYDFGESGLLDLSGQVLFVRVQLASGFNQDPDAPGGVQFYVQTTNDWCYGEASWQNVETDSTGTWVTYTFDLENPGHVGDAAVYDPSQIRAIGIVFNTGDGPAGQSGSLPVDAVFYIDCLGYRPAS